MKHTHLYVLVSILFLVGMVLFLYKVMILNYPVIPRSKSTLWTLEAEIRFKASGQPVKATLYIPDQQSGFTIIKENFITRNYGHKSSLSGKKKKSIWTIRQADGDQILYYRTIISPKNNIDFIPDPPKLIKPSYQGIYKLAANSIIDEITSKSADTESLVTELLKLLDKPNQNENILLFAKDKMGHFTKSNIAAQLLKYAGFKARSAHGLNLKKNEKNATFVHWLEIYENNRWIPYNIATGDQEIPDTYFAWWYGSNNIFKLTGAITPKVTISTFQEEKGELSSILTPKHKKNNYLVRFSLFSLPLHTQAVYRIMLLVPLGALILVFFRNIIGIKTFGTFMPILVALAFRETNLLWGLLLFTILISLGLSIRFYLSKLQLLLVPRLASLVTIVVLLMLALSILSNHLDIPAGLSIALFPMIIITMTIERMSIIWEERGPKEAIKQALGSLFVAVCSFPLFVSNTAEYILFVFPELLLPVLAITLISGRYTGYKLAELYRFREIKHDLSVNN